MRVAERQIGVGDFTVTDRMRELANQVLDTGRISYGPMSSQFERDFAKLHECHHGVLSNSGTSSLQVALQTLKELHGWRDGDRVLVPSVTFVATINVILHNNLTPVLVDVDPRYYDIDVDQMTKALWGNPNIRCIIPVHLFGQPCDMHGVINAAHWLSDREIKVIEDSCECMFAEHRCKPVGAWGDIGCFSTYVAHILSTGVGGIATTNNEDYAAKMRSLVNHGRDGIYISIDDDIDRSREVISRRFNFTSVGHSYRITELEAALALAQLETWRENIAARQLNAARLTAGLEHLQDRLQLPAVRADSSHSFMMYPIVLKEGNKWDLIYYLEERGVETRELLRLTDQPCYRGMWDPNDYPVAKWLNEQGFYLGCHPGLTRDDIDYAIDAFNQFFDKS